MVLLSLLSPIALAITASNQVSITSFGAIGDGKTDGSAAIQRALNVGGVINVPTGTYRITQNLQISSNTTLTGPGTILGVNIPPVTSPNYVGPTIPTLEVHGTAGTPVAIVSPISAGTTTLQTSNSLHPGDFVILNNYPADPGGSDRCVLTASLTCSYPNSGPSSQRQNRRREMLVISSATSSSLTFTTATLFSYTTFDTYEGRQGYAFLTLVSPISHVTFQGLTLNGVTVDAVYASQLNIQGVVSRSAAINGHPCYDCSVSVTDFDGQGTNQSVVFFEGSQQIQVEGTFRNGACPSDCGIVKLNQVSGAIINVSLGDMMQSVPGAYEHGIMIDTDYAEDPSGFTDVPDLNVIASATSMDETNPSDVFVTGNPSAPPTNVVISESGGTYVYLKGVSKGILNSVGAESSLRIDGCSNITIIGGNYTNLDMNPVTDQLGVSHESSDLSFLGTTFTEKKIPFFNQVIGLNLSGVTFDVTQQNGVNQTFFPVANFNTVSNLILDHVRVKSAPAAQGLQFWASGSVSNVVTFGGLPVPFPGVTTYGN